MKIFLIAIFIIAIVVCQMTVLARFSFLSVAPNLALAGVLALAICQKEEKDYWWMFLFSLFFDLLAGRPFGVFTLSACLTFFSVELLVGIIFKQNNFLALLSLAFIGAVFFELYQFLLMKLFAVWRITEPLEISPLYFYAILPLRIFYNGALTLICLWALRKSRWLNIYG